MVYLIAYEIEERLRDYSALKDCIKGLGDYQHPMETVWFVRTSKTAEDIVEQLKTHLHLEHDHLFVMPVEEDSRYKGWMQKALWKWLRQ
jgi:hypothetical protein